MLRIFFFSYLWWFFHLKICIFINAFILAYKSKKNLLRLALSLTTLTIYYYLILLFFLCAFMIPVFKPTWTWIWNFDISNIILYALIFLFLRQSKPKFPHSFLSSNISQNTQLSFVMPSKQGGTQKPLKAPKKERKELDEDDLALKAKLKAEKQALADFAANAKKKWRACLQFAKKLRRPISSFLFLLIFITFIPNTHSFLFDSGKKRKMYCLIFSFVGDLLSIQNIFV